MLNFVIIELYRAKTSLIKYHPTQKRSSIPNTQIIEQITLILNLNEQNAIGFLMTNVTPNKLERNNFKLVNLNQI
jgi:hypothetical protein